MDCGCFELEMEKMMLSRITCVVALSLGLATSVPTVSLAETTPDAEQLEFNGLQRLLGGETTTAIASLETLKGDNIPTRFVSSGIEH